MKTIEPEMVTIPAGEVTLGAPACPAEYLSEHRWVGPRQVRIEAFQIARHCVTRAEYELFVTDSQHPAPVDWEDSTLQNPRQPVCGISAEDADAYCQWLSDKTGKAYRLPRADEWEKATRGGLQGKRFPWGDEPAEGRCCHGRGDTGAPMPVGSFEPNGFGLFDMAGNVWQWLADLYVDIAEDPPTNTPTGKPAEINRVLVGGSFMTGNTEPLWVAYRHEDPPDLRHRCLGFRLAL